MTDLPPYHLMSDDQSEKRKQFMEDVKVKKPDLGYPYIIIYKNNQKSLVYTEVETPWTSESGFLAHWQRGMQGNSPQNIVDALKENHCSENPMTFIVDMTKNHPTIKKVYEILREEGTSISRVKLTCQ